MKVHLIIAHPENNSFNHALHQTAVQTFEANEISIGESDLYHINFSAVAGKKDSPNFPVDGTFQLAAAQRWAIENDDFETSIKIEQSKLDSADVLILQFPLWWWSFPAILKGWIDRVLTSGFAYGEKSRLGKKKVMYSITTGGAENEDERDYYKRKIDGLYHDVFGFIGWECLPPFIAHGVQRETEKVRETMLLNYRQHLIKNLL
ncbi:hypothetical protein CJF42_03415 [Pseudoalteromonas sp. NBT06-2]|uniref:NAD(P)H-dependent oxidoreductase n=1 Tax=Pseudoalteromonas sp. NBT06-2 TaxID=2025950 RepID=UPI000BA579F7|nr:NAD(P)H-dependent oxidoreductase [Pseudoalteromonas sp. NBT06-2]PAJ75777.1 hypothetical protein CJF42_03415 [Pseudoalteromonas sp. NBT06-2]